MSWWDDMKYKRPLTERTEGVTDTARVWRPGNWCICDQCGKEFTSKRRVYGTKYCSSKCRQKHYRQTKKLD